MDIIELAAVMCGGGSCIMLLLRFFAKKVMGTSNSGTVLRWKRNSCKDLSSQPSEQKQSDVFKNRWEGPQIYLPTGFPGSTLDLAKLGRETSGDQISKLTFRGNTQ